MNAIIKSIPTPTELGHLMLEGIASAQLAEEEPPVDHYHAEGLYGRRIYCKAGTLVVTKQHRKQHITIALKGRCTVVDEQGRRRSVVAPAVFVTEPGTQRSVYCHTDVEWITCHHTDLSEVDEIEAELVEDPLEMHRAIIADREDYRALIADIGITEEAARDISEQDDMIDQHDCHVYEILYSERQGLGVFAKSHHEPGARIAAARVGSFRTPAGRYCNHSKKPNARFVSHGDGLDIEAIREIRSGDEITVNYRDALAASIDATNRLEGNKP